ncbi:SIMPL domain-containing protein [Methylocystis sp. WRRC1]|uniref:SIMPL domain-containing protein n=1 Tax=Methylocystis sp. WRRC1 TaxID=1732014 RepID=UPI001D14670F|nr:SIMPL domain-containing protein [Methylocystis sp. WRRC1]MCC3246630.1 SIMPL domain-containing protein [Methylocystis sp. WRRC1]
MIRFAFALSLVLTGCVSVSAEPLKDTVPNISVVGEAFEEVAPDRATLRFGVVTERPTAAEAATENARVAAEILAELKSLGVADVDIQTQGVTLEPFTIEEHDAKGKSKGVQKLYRARNDLAARVKPLDKAGAIAGRLIDKGVNSFDGVEYDFSNPDEKLDALRAAAVKDAERRARTYAEAAGLRLGRVLEIRPVDSEIPQMRPYAARLAPAPEATQVPMRPGLQRISSRVSVTWALGR